MSEPKIHTLVDEMTAVCQRGPFFFYDLVREFHAAAYRDILVAWGRIRETAHFDRDEDGRYILAPSKEGV